ncbi:ClpB domain-containing protein [Variovorax paradoxus B4]|uniref:ClpB domain-containing protein n=1 Tax=Variovorax paradoxus B4 TaxID=1246301 RepID=T1XKV7_VARPD|nr:ClpB domain-containing protein [Variovorax paradoxus B4]
MSGSSANGNAIASMRKSTLAVLVEIEKVGFDPVFRARPLSRAIQQRLENPLWRLGPHA